MSMSVLIRGMKMPNNCCECRLLSGFECRALLKDITEFPVADDCPLVPVPPHGRLVDARGMFLPFVAKGQRSKRYHLGEKWELNGAEIREVIDSLPTVIPAEEGEL